MELTGDIFNIQRFSLHDGPGIRTTIFFKGCPLNCTWCQNPEGLNNDFSIFTYKNKCLGCGSCIEECKEGALVLENRGPVIDRRLCVMCLDCVAVCPVGAIQSAGEKATITEIVNEVLKDRIVFEESGGGVTLSGGEPLMQPKFLNALLKAFKNESINTTVETSGYAPWPILKEAAEWTDLFLYDLKLADEDQSNRHIGATSKIILRNLEALNENGCNIRVRMPLIPSVNCDQESIKKAVESLKKCGVTKLELIPYHNLGSGKYESLDLEYRGAHLEVPTPELIENIKSAFEQQGIKIVSEVE